MKVARISKYQLVKWLIVFSVFYSIAMLSPLVVDDYYFVSLQFDSFSELICFVLHYGNGRILGNLSVLFFLKHRIVLSMIKALTFLLIGIFMTKIIDGIVGGKNENIVFLLLIAMAPQIFAQVFSWTSGFCNYAPPILCGLYLVYNFVISKRKQGWIDALVVFLVGGGVNCLLNTVQS